MRQLTVGLLLALFIFALHSTALSQIKRDPRKTPLPKTDSTRQVITNPVPPGGGEGGEGNPTPECLTAFAGTDQTFCTGEGMQLGMAYDPTYVYSWSPATGLSAVNIPNPVASPTQTTTYTLVLTPKTNMLVNGSFESGNTGFGSDFFYGLGTYSAPAYSIESTGSAQYAWWCGTSATHGNKMLIADGVTSGSQRVWYETVNVTPNGNYTFSGQFLNLYNTNAFNDPGIVVKINGTNVGGIASLAFTGCSWQLLNIPWTAGSSDYTATIEIYNECPQSGTYGNDFAIDNLSFIGRQCLTTMSTVTVFVGGPVIVADNFDPWENPGFPAGNTVTMSNDGEIVSCNHNEFSQPVRLIATNVPPGTSVDWYKNDVWESYGPNHYVVGSVSKGLTGPYSDKYTAKLRESECTSDPRWLTFICEPFTISSSLSSGIFTVEMFDYVSIITTWPYSYPYTQSPVYNWTVDDPNVIWITSPNQPIAQFTFPANYHPGVIKYNAHVSNTRYGCANTSSWEHDYVSVKTKDSLTRRTPVPESTSKVLVYPNPAKNAIQVSSKEQFIKIQLFTTNGALRKVYNRAGTQAEIDVSDLLPGTYFVNVICDKSIKTEKVIIVK